MVENLELEELVLRILTDAYGEKIAKRKLPTHMRETPHGFTLAKQIKKYGPEEAEKRFIINLKKNKEKGTLAGYIQRYGEEEGARLYKEKNAKLSVGIGALRRSGKTDEEIAEIRATHAAKSAITLNRFISKYGNELGSALFSEYVEKIKRKSVRRLDGWIYRGYSETEAVAKLKEVQATSTKEKFISRYGEEEGIRKYLDVNCKKTAVAYTSGSVSKLETSFFYELAKITNVNLESGTTCKILCGESVYYCDYLDPDNNTIIEIYGDFWHMNPKLYQETSINKITKQSAKEIWERDNARFDKLRTFGYNVLVIWESDIKNNLNLCLTTAKEFLESNENQINHQRSREKTNR